jgi:NAD(P)-dependent dehydrogenase (short-subunit alcohol dehydrogenase family)
VIEVWEVDLGKFDSVKAFCKRAGELERLDVVVENAGIAIPTFELVEGYESTIAVNVVGTFLMALLLIPKLRESGERFGTEPRLTIVASDAHEQARYFSSLLPLEKEYWKLIIGSRRRSKSKTQTTSSKP